MIRYLFVPFMILLAMSCTPSQKQSQENALGEKTNAGVTVEPFGTLGDGTSISLYTLSNSKGMKMKVMNYGGIITSLLVPTKDGQRIDVVLGYDSLQQYVERNPFFGALVGRYGNRIAKGSFTLDGTRYELVKNNNENHLHGGTKGFDKVVWKIDEVPASDGAAIRLTYRSPDMEEGYPGNLDAEVTYTLTEDNTVLFDYKATTDKKTIINLTQHTYFNLNGGKTDILQHEIALNADQFVPVNEALIPTGKLMPVENTPFDFRTPVAIGARINSDHQQIRYGKGYDHTWVINGEGFRTAAVVSDPASGIEMTLKTTQPGVQFYTGNFLDGTITGKNGVVYRQRTGFCLETQHFPDSPNQPSFPSVVLSPGETYASTTSFSFQTR